MLAHGSGNIPNLGEGTAGGPPLSIALPNDEAPYTTEAYSGEVREFYEDRADYLKYRSVSQCGSLSAALWLHPTCGVPPIGQSDTPVEVRLYRRERCDGVHEVEARVDGSYLAISLLPEARCPSRVGPDAQWLGITLGRGYNCYLTHYLRWISSGGPGGAALSYALGYEPPSQHTAVDATVDGRLATCRDGDGILQVCVALDEGARVEIRGHGGDEGLVNTGDADVCGDQRSPVPTDGAEGSFSDNAVSLIKRKVRRVAMRHDPLRSPFSICEVLYTVGYPDATPADASAGTTLLVSPPPLSALPHATTVVGYKNEFNRTITVEYRQFEMADDDGRYVAARALVMKALKLLAAAEAEVHPLSSTVGTRQLASVFY